MAIYLQMTREIGLEKHDQKLFDSINNKGYNSLIDAINDIASSMNFPGEDNIDVATIKIDVGVRGL